MLHHGKFLFIALFKQVHQFPEDISDVDCYSLKMVELLLQYYEGKKT